MNFEVFMWSSFAILNFCFGIADALEGKLLWSLIDSIAAGACVYCLIDTFGVI
jgi:hypothetical protein